MTADSYLIWGTPIAALAYFVVSLVLFIMFSRRLREGNECAAAHKRVWRAHLIASSIILGVIVTVYVCGFILLMLAIAHM